MKLTTVQSAQKSGAEFEPVSVVLSSTPRRPFSIPGFLLLLSLVLAHHASHANVYKCEQADGKVAYQADPCTNGQEITSKVSRPSLANSVASVVSATDKRQCVGKEIRINFSNMPLRSTLQVLADYSGFKLVADPSVSGAAAFNYECVPWDAILQDVAARHELVVKIENGTIYARKR